MSESHEHKANAIVESLRGGLNERESLIVVTMNEKGATFAASVAYGMRGPVTLCEEMRATYDRVLKRGGYEATGKLLDFTKRTVEIAVENERALVVAHLRAYLEHGHIPPSAADEIERGEHVK